MKHPRVKVDAYGISVGFYSYMDVKVFGDTSENVDEAKSPRFLFVYTSVLWTILCFKQLKLVYMQTYVSAPKGDMSGWYIVEKWNTIEQRYIPLKGEEYPTEDQAKARASELNRTEKEDNKEGGEK